MSEEQLELDPKNYVVVRIWTPEKSKNIQGHNSVGHVSLQVCHTDLEGNTNHQYLSFWPGSDFTREEIRNYQNANWIKQQDLYYYHERSGEIIEDFDTDVDLEGGEPQLTVYLYSLDLEKLLDERNRILGECFEGSNETNSNERPNFRLIGSGFSLFSDCALSTSHNCSSFVYSLLLAGGIGKQISSSQRSNHSLYTQPDKIYELVEEVKDKEVRDYPETKDFDVQNSAKYDYKEDKGCTLF